jgi:hypothetical protein
MCCACGGGEPIEEEEKDDNTPTPEEECNNEFQNLAGSDDQIDLLEFMKRLPTTSGWCEGWTDELKELAFNEFTGEDDFLNSSEWLQLCTNLQNPDWEPTPPPQPTPEEECAEKFPVAANGDEVITLNEFMDIPTTWGFCQNWSEEMKVNAFNDAKGTSENLDSIRW